jgi:hypothetical protein
MAGESNLEVVTVASQHPADPNMVMALVFADALGPVPTLPESLKAARLRAELIHAIDGPLVTRLGDVVDVTRQIAEQIRRIEEGSRRFMPDVPDTMVRINICLRLWSGCLSAAKTIAHETRSGPNTPSMRVQLTQEIEQVAASDAVFAAGVEAAQAFKRHRNETYSLEGVPTGSLVLRDD